MSDYTEFFLASRADVVQLELFELSHPNFTQAYRVTRNARDGVTVDLSADELAIDFAYYPAKVAQQGARDDLDFGIRVDLGDVGEVIPGELDAVAAAGGFLTKPALRYWAFRSDQLDAPIFGPVVLEVPRMALANTGTSFDAQAPQLNANKTGERQTIDRFPMQRGFLG
jgi:hypothetical protein